MYQAQLQSYRAAYGANMSEQLLKQLGVEQQILQQMVDERAALSEANRIGVKVSDQEVAQRIFAIPAFQENGAFIGKQRYQQVLASQRPPLTTSEFEENVRRSLAVDKLRTTITDWVAVSDKELEQEYRRRNDKVKLAIVTFNADSFRLDVSASDADVAAYFEAHTEAFRVPEKRKVKYLLIDVDALRAKITVPPADIERAYNDEPRAVHDARAGPREPHPDQDRRQGRRDGEGQGRGRAEAGESARRRFRRAREEVLGGRVERR